MTKYTYLVDFFKYNVLQYFKVQLEDTVLKQRSEAKYWML